MIVNQIDVAGISTVEPKYDAPVGRDADRPIASKFALQRMQPEARKVHVPWLRRLVEAGQDTFDLVGRIPMPPAAGPLSRKEA